MRSLGNCSDVLGFTCISTPKLQTRSAHNISHEYSHPSDTMAGLSPSLLYSALVPGTPGSRNSVTPFHNLATMQPRGMARSLQGRVTCTTRKDSEEGCGLELLMEGLCDSVSYIEVLRLVVYLCTYLLTMHGWSSLSGLPSSDTGYSDSTDDERKTVF
ncbi:hypothetical protein N656DRAFT_60117 [Canariomyces notabilis]|uniref:Uncharacterized protein n=1 Tax=Canariomyces notabilis TaxID=2074819 RepID=A0AAN6TP45_9PEZI|nr:hypothetical protein N656DRAFT_60117 [Canariomyces arenarius]